MLTLSLPVGDLGSSLREYVLSSSGTTSPGQGLSLGGVSAVLSALAVVLGVQGRAEADYCYGIPSGQCNWICTSQSCTDPFTWYKQYCHDTPESGCWEVSRHCGC